MTLPVELPRLADLLDGALAYSIPLLRTFRGLRQREGLLLHGPSGWGEFAPFDDYTEQASARWLSAAIEAAWGTWPTALRNQVSVNAIVPSVEAADAQLLVRQSGCTSVKVKVAERGQSLDDDVARVAAVRAELGPKGRVRVDANAGWSVVEATTALKELSQFGLEFAEQPCKGLSDMSQLRRLVDVALAVDEGVRLAPNPADVSGVQEAADVLVLKVAPLGGADVALAVADHYGLPVVISSALESSIGLSAGLAMAAALPELDFACGLGSGRLFTADVVARPLLPVAGLLSVQRPEVDTAAAEAVSGSSDSLAQWRTRAATAYEVLTAGATSADATSSGGRR